MSWTLTEITNANKDASERLIAVPLKHHEGPGGIFIVTPGFTMLGDACFGIAQFDPVTRSIRDVKKGGKPLTFTTRKSAYRKAESLSTGLSRCQSLAPFPYVAHSHLR